MQVMLLVDVLHEFPDICLFRVLGPPERRFSQLGHDRILIQRFLSSFSYIE